MRWQPPRWMTGAPRPLTDLPADLQALVATTIAEARLTRRDRRAVENEIADHFASAIEEGVPVPELARDFGDPQLAAHLIGRAARRRRRARGHTMLRTGIGAQLAIAALIYAVSAIGLYTTRPAAAFGTMDAAFGGQPSETGAMATRWGAGAGEAVAAERRAVAASALTGRPACAEAHALLVLADEWRRSGSLQLEMASLAITADMLQLLAKLPDESVRGLTEMERGALVRVIELADRAGPLAPRTETLAPAVDDLLPRIYAGNDGRGNLTARGLRLTQALLGKPTATPAAILLEPVYFVARGNGAQAADLAARLIAAADGDARNGTDASPSRLARAIAAAEAEHVSPFHLFPMTALFKQVEAAAAAGRRAERLLPMVRRRFT